MKFSAVVLMAAGLASAKPIMRRQAGPDQPINQIMQKVLDALTALDAAIVDFNGSEQEGAAVQTASENMYTVVKTAQGEVEPLPVMTEEEGEAFLAVSDPLDAMGAQLHKDLDGKNSLFASLGMCASILDVITVIGDESIKLMWAVEAKFDSDSTHGQEKITEFEEAFDKSEELLRQCAQNEPAQNEDENQGEGQGQNEGKGDSQNEGKGDSHSESEGEGESHSESEGEGEKSKTKITSSTFTY